MVPFNTLIVCAILPLFVHAFIAAVDEQFILLPLTPQLAPAKWEHPGYVVNKPQLDFVKAKVASKTQPWTDAYNQMLKDSDKYGKYVSGTRTSKAAPTVSCGPTTNPDIHCTDERGDALAAWANALAWYVSGDEAYAKNAIGLMNKWSYTIKGTSVLYPRLSEFVMLTDISAHALSNAVLQTAWSGASWARAGELIRHTTAELWSSGDITQFEDMLRNVYLPAVKNGDTRASNWDVGKQSLFT